jgi:DNA-directed RNA polymerases I and III subunit RPAC1
MGDRRKIMEWMKPYRKPEPGQRADDMCVDFNTAEVSLQIECTRNENAVPGETDPKKLYHNSSVYAKDLVFVPNGEQTWRFTGDAAIRPVNPDILIAKLRPGQGIALSAHLHLGIGADHAKFSPVATASYRLMPTITIKSPIIGDEAEKFAKCFAKGVIGLERITRREANTKDSGYESHEGKKKAVVKDAMKDTVSRECLRHPEFKDKVKLGRKRDHFIFSIESTGQWDADDLFMEAVLVLRKKCVRLEKQVINMVR